MANNNKLLTGCCCCWGLPVIAQLLPCQLQLQLGAKIAKVEEEAEANFKCAKRQHYRSHRLQLLFRCCCCCCWRRRDRQHSNSQSVLTARPLCFSICAAGSRTQIKLASALRGVGRHSQYFFMARHTHKYMFFVLYAASSLIRSWFFALFYTYFILYEWPNQLPLTTSGFFFPLPKGFDQQQHSTFDSRQQGQAHKINFKLISIIYLWTW